jgi:hypothetical protein
MPFMLSHSVYQKVRSLCSEKFYYKHSDAIYKTLEKEYFMMFGEVTEKDIEHVVQEFKDFFGEEA